MKKENIFNKSIKYVKTIFYFKLVASHRTDNQVISCSRDKKETNTLLGWLRKKLEQRKLRKENLKELHYDDWYYHHSWFEKAYFIDKLKRKLMNFIYRLYTSIEDNLLSNFLFEVEFYTPKSNSLDEFNKENGTKYLGDFKCYLPIIIKAKEFSEAESISIAIRKELELEYGAQLTSFYVLDEIITKEKLNQKEEVIKNKFIGFENSLGFIDINTFTPKEFDSNGNTYSLREGKKHFRVLKTGPTPFRSQNFEYLIKYYKTSNTL